MWSRQQLPKHFHNECSHFISTILHNHLYIWCSCSLCSSVCQINRKAESRLIIEVMIQKKNQIGGGRCNQDLQLLINIIAELDRDQNKHPNLMGNVHCLDLLQLSSSVLRECTLLKCIFKSTRSDNRTSTTSSVFQRVRKTPRALGCFHIPPTTVTSTALAVASLDVHCSFDTHGQKPGTSKHQEREKFVFVQNGRIEKEESRKCELC